MPQYILSLSINVMNIQKGFNRVERLNHYVMSLPCEEESKDGADVMPEIPLAIKEIKVDIHVGVEIGVFGHTGAGKS